MLARTSRTDTPAPDDRAAARLTLQDATNVSQAWPFEEARKLVKRSPTGNEVIFETGYGPSGLPHIGTFGEVARTSMVRHAFRVLTQRHDQDAPDRLFRRHGRAAQSPRQHSQQGAARRASRQAADPRARSFRHADSFGAHNNARLRAFLDRFGFEYEFASSTDYYASGRFDEALLRMLARLRRGHGDHAADASGEERRATYSPFLPIHPRDRHGHAGADRRTSTPQPARSSGAIPTTGEEFDDAVTGGHCKLQWKPDWAMRWYALGIDYEMAGKDLIDRSSFRRRSCARSAAEPPEGFNYELFLDEKGQKISKSKGNGLTIEEWLTYASPESLSLFMFQKPTAAKRLYFDVIPRTVDDYLAFLDAYPRQELKERLGNPVWHIHAGAAAGAGDVAPRRGRGTTVSFGMLLNLAAVANSEDPAVLWGFLRRYAPRVSPENHPRLDRLVALRRALFPRFRRARKRRYRAADEVEREALAQLVGMLAALPRDASAEDDPDALYDIARPIPRYQDLKAKGATPERPGVSNEWFNMLYQVLLGESRGPRFGSFVALYGCRKRGN